MDIETKDKVLEKIDNNLSQTSELVSSLTADLKGKQVTAKAQEYLQTFELRHKEYLNKIESDANYEQVIQSVSNAYTYSRALADALLKNPAPFDEKVQTKLKRILNLANSIQKSIEERNVIFGEENLVVARPEFKRKVKSTITLPGSNPSEEINELIKSFKQQLTESEDRHMKKEAALSSNIEELNNKLNLLEDHVQEKVDAADLLYNETEIKLTEKKNSVDELLGKVSEGVIAHGFDTSAAEEKKIANILRIGSLFCMVVIAIVIGFSLYETTTEAFKWENSTFRLIFTILLSVPAAYLARESAKHRQQQYAHLQTSLNLKAIGPYLASLPEEEQHRLKSEIASRLFAPKDSSVKDVDSYPINAQELLMKLLDKADFKPKKGSSTG